MDLRMAAYQPDMAPNLGALIRISACMAVPLDVIEPCGFPFSIKALRSSALDYVADADIARHDSWLDFLRQRAAGRLILLSTKAAVPHWDFSYSPGDTLLLGRESAGVPDAVRDACDAAVRIAMPGHGRSLNIAVAAGIAVAEALRQLRHVP